MSASLPSPAREVRILVAEPSRTLSALIRAALAELGAEIEMAPDGAHALALARVRLPDLLVCDQGLPGLDGYALSHALKQLPGGKKVLTLLLVPDHLNPDPERLAYVGIHDVLAKPFERAVLLERVRGMLALPERARAAAPDAGLRANAPMVGAPSNSYPKATPGLRVEARTEVERTPTRPPESFAPVARAPVAPVAHVAPAAPTVSAAEIAALVNEAVDARLDARLEARLDARLSALVTQRLPALLDGALARLLPQAVLEATQRAVAERVPGAVEGAARNALVEIATPARVDKIVGEVARAVAEQAIAAALAPLVAGAVESVKARVEGELLGRLDLFARTELPARLTSHAEQIVWKVVPTIAEDLVKEEIKRLSSE